MCRFSCRTILVQMMSAAGTGYCFNTKRNRLREKLVLRKHDPKGDIIFNARDPELPPDFIFGEDAEFLPEPSELPGPPSTSSLAARVRTAGGEGLRQLPSRCKRDWAAGESRWGGGEIVGTAVEGREGVRSICIGPCVTHEARAVFRVGCLVVYSMPDGKPARFHLMSWDAGDTECLLQLVKELIQQYHQYQCQRLRESSRLLFEYDSLLEDPLYGRSMEVYAGHKNSWTGEFSARFLLKLPVDFSNIPVYLLKDTALDPGEDVALLSVSFEDAEATQVFPKLYLSPSIEHHTQLALPPSLPPGGRKCTLHIPASPCLALPVPPAGGSVCLRARVASRCEEAPDVCQCPWRPMCGAPRELGQPVSPPQGPRASRALGALASLSDEATHLPSDSPPHTHVHRNAQDVGAEESGWIPFILPFPILHPALSPSPLNALGGSSALHIPAFPGGGCLIDYVPQVCQLLTNKVQYVIQGYHKRREYIAAFLSYFGMGVVEYDAEGFTKLTLLLMWKDFCCLVHIDLPLYFPRDQPTLTFQSVYHFTSSGQLYSQVQKSYPYSPRWDGNEMAKRAK
ncbi:BABA2 protein, partial [Atractosteus spatula]|nr:BABA2 protein [Atractosteus spatula]